jgi:serine/threonine protein kinase
LHRCLKQQERDPKTQQVLAVVKKQPPELCLRWMKELSAAAARLEAIGLVHGDIRPPNVLFDSQYHVKLCDFDRSLGVGEHLDCGTEPFAWLLGDEGGRDCGSYGKTGPRTEQFAIGSVIYSITRGHDPCEDEWFGREHIPTIMKRFQKMQFPYLAGSEVDVIIWKCWYGRFASVKQLSEEVMALGGGLEGIRVESTEWFEDRKADCKEMIRNGVLKTLKI